MAVKAVIFDWAGTTVDFGCLAPAIVFVEVFNNRGIDLTIEQARISMGLAKKDHLRELLKLQFISEQWKSKFNRAPNEEDVNLLFSELEPALIRIADRFASPVRGTAELVKELQHSGILVGTTTGYGGVIMEKIIPVAADNGFAPDCVITSSEVPNGRPAPYMCYLNAMRLNVYPLNKMIKIGDTTADIFEGLNAGMWTIGITQTGNEFGLSEADFLKLGIQDVIRNTAAAATKLYRAGAHYIVNGIWDCLPVIQHINERIERGETPVFQFPETLK
jgi:phosphonoacetaldehyde hydrolase